MENKDFIISKFKEVKSLEYVPSNRANNTGIGKTFEDYIGVVENNLDEPDLAGFEINLTASRFIMLLRYPIHEKPLISQTCECLFKR